MGTGESDDIVTQLPNAWARGAEPSYVPTFGVPLALMLHGLVLWRLQRGTAATGRLAAA